VNDAGSVRSLNEAAGTQGGDADAAELLMHRLEVRPERLGMNGGSARLGMSVTRDKETPTRHVQEHVDGVIGVPVAGIEVQEQQSGVLLLAERGVLQQGIERRLAGLPLRCEGGVGVKGREWRCQGMVGGEGRLVELGEEDTALEEGRTRMVEEGKALEQQGGRLMDLVEMQGGAIRPVTLEVFGEFFENAWEGDFAGEESLDGAGEILDEAEGLRIGVVLEEESDAEQETVAGEEQSVVVLERGVREEGILERLPMEEVRFEVAEVSGEGLEDEVPGGFGGAAEVGGRGNGVGRHAFMVWAVLVGRAWGKRKRGPKAS
jgi:hypothetical protein